MEEFKKLILPLLVAAAVIIGVGFLTQKTNLKPTAESKTTREIKIGRAILKAEVAQTEEQRQKGLSGRDRLGENEGLLFIFDQKGATPTFWMKGMKFPIDIIWIGKDKIIKIDTKVAPPAPNTPDSKLTLYKTNFPIDYVLEINSGYSDLNNIKVGDTVLIE